MERLHQNLGTKKDTISLATAVCGVGHAARTLFFVPDHDSSYYQNVAQQLRSVKQPIQPTLAPEVLTIRQVLVCAVHHSPPKLLSRARLLGLVGVFMQFTIHLPRLRPYYLTPFEDVERLYQACIKQGVSKCLTFSEQLEIALHQTSGDLPEALWRLFVTCRLYARWLDADLIVDMPAMTGEEIQKRMYAWSQSLAACKAADGCLDQDVSGDTYYCWTHALAKVVYQFLPAKRTLLVRLESDALHHGTLLNHGILHKFAPQRMPSNHYVAAAYGNAIGRECVAVLEEGKSK